MNEAQEETRSCRRKAKYTSADTFKVVSKTSQSGVWQQGEHQFTTARERSCAAPLFNLPGSEQIPSYGEGKHLFLKSTLKPGMNDCSVTCTP